MSQTLMTIAFTVPVDKLQAQCHWFAAGLRFSRGKWRRVHHISTMVRGLLEFMGGSIELHEGVKLVSLGWLLSLQGRLRSGFPSYQSSKTQCECSDLVRN
jgi:hypothetical protein